MPKTLDDVFRTFATARLVVPMRLHALILAGLAGSPLAALSYDPKVEAAARMAEVPWSDLDALPGTTILVRLWRDVLDCGVDPARIEAIRQRSAAHGHLFSKDTNKI